MSYLREICKQGRDANPFFKLMDIEISTYGNGESELNMLVRPDMLNGVGWLQGGIYTALCDEAMALALFTVLEEDAAIATISENTCFMQGVRSGRIIARARVVKKGRRVSFMEGSVVSEDGTRLTETRASFAVIIKSTEKSKK